MQQKFKIGDKVKVLTNVYGCDIHGKVGTIIKLNGATCIVERNMQNYDQEEWGRVEEDSWRYAFHEDELELVEDKPKTKFKAGDKVVCVDEGDNLHITKGSEYVVWLSSDDKVVITNDTRWYTDTYPTSLFKLVTDREVSNPEPNVQITVDVDENICAAFNEVKNGLEILLSGKSEPDYVIGQEVYVSNDFNRYLRKGVLLDAIPRNGLMHVNIGGFDCYVEEERVYTREETKGN